MFIVDSMIVNGFLQSGTDSVHLNQSSALSTLKHGRYPRALVQAGTSTTRKRRIDEFNEDRLGDATLSDSTR